MQTFCPFTLFVHLLPGDRSEILQQLYFFLTKGMDAKRKEELERKRQKLAELRKAREQRSNSNASSSIAASVSQTSSGSKGVDDLVNSLIGGVVIESSAATAAANAYVDEPVAEKEVEENKALTAVDADQKKMKKKPVLTVIKCSSISFKPMASVVVCVLLSVARTYGLL